MNFFVKFVDIIMHLDKYLSVLIKQYGIGTYLILFILVFCETGLVVTPFLPGDSVIFACGAFAALKALNIWSLWAMFFLAAFLGDTANYFIGKKIGTGIFEKEDNKFINKEHLMKAHNFYEKHGSITIVIARFIPIIRTFAPFVAGIGEMKYSKFIAYNLIGGIMWVSLFLGLGFFFGNLTFVRNHFTYVLVAIIFISLIPAVIAFIGDKKEKKQETENN